MSINYHPVPSESVSSGDDVGLTKLVDVWRNRNNAPEYKLRRGIAALTLVGVTIGIGWAVDKIGEQLPGIKDQAGFAVVDGESLEQVTDDMCTAVAEVNDGNDTGCKELADTIGHNALASASGKEGAAMVTVSSWREGFGGPTKIVTNVVPAAR